MESMKLLGKTFTAQPYPLWMHVTGPMSDTASYLVIGWDTDTDRHGVTTLLPVLAGRASGRDGDEVYGADVIARAAWYTFALQPLECSEMFCVS